MSQLSARAARLTPLPPVVNQLLPCGHVSTRVTGCSGCCLVLTGGKAGLAPQALGAFSAGHVEVCFPGWKPFRKLSPPAPQKWETEVGAPGKHSGALHQASSSPRPLKPRGTRPGAPGGAPPLASPLWGPRLLPWDLTHTPPLPARLFPLSRSSRPGPGERP